MNILAINTVGSACEAAVIGPGGEFAVCEEMARGHDARIAPVVERAMREAGLSWPDVDRIGVVTGPGSFTGIRVGVAFARGLALALKIPAVGVTALEALGVEHAGSVLAVLPAQRRPPELTWWAQVLNDRRGVAPPVEIDEGEVVRLAQSAEMLVGQLAPAALVKNFEERTPSALAAARLCGAIEADMPLARPTYVRAPDAAPMRSAAEVRRD